MALCGATLPDDEEKRTHERECKAKVCAERKTKKTLSEQHTAELSFHHVQVPLMSTSPNGPTWSALSSTSESVAESTSSDASSVLYSRRSSVNTDGLWIDSAYAPDIANLRRDVGTLHDDSGSTEPKKKRTRNEMSDYEKKKADGKNLNEQAKRQDLGEHMRHLQDLLDMYCSISEGTVQATPNGKSSLLWLSKEDIMVNAEALLMHFLDKGSKEAIRNDDVASFIEEMETAVKTYRDKEKNGISVTQGTLLDDSGARPCTSFNNKRDIRCTTHDHPDVRVCRKEQGKRAVARNSALYKDQVQNKKTK